jgi:hypothetical protein
MCVEADIMPMFIRHLLIRLYRLLEYGTDVLYCLVIAGNEKNVDSSSVVNAADVVLFGLDIIVPFMNAELLKVRI